jgi:hypothetical protein
VHDSAKGWVSDAQKVFIEEKRRLAAILAAKLAANCTEPERDVGGCNLNPKP